MTTNKILYPIFFLLFLVSCSSEPPTGKTEAEVLFKEAQELIDSGRYILATEKLNTIKTNYPYSFYATPAELMLADVLYQQENYAEAAAAFLLFRDMHPKHPKIPYVIWMIGQSYYAQLPDTFDRDLSVAKEAMKYYAEIIQKYSKSEYVNKAKEKIQTCQKMILQKELYIADFYYRTEVHQAARWRYMRILRNGFSPEDKKMAMARIVVTSYRMGEFETCLKYYDRFTSVIGKSRNEDLKPTIKNCRSKKPFVGSRPWI